MKNTKQQLDELKGLQDGWCGHDCGVGLDTWHMDHIEPFLVDLCGNVIPQPAIYPSPDGGLVLVWGECNNNEPEIHVEIYFNDNIDCILMVIWSGDDESGEFIDIEGFEGDKPISLLTKDGQNEFMSILQNVFNSGKS